MEGTADKGPAQHGQALMQQSLDSILQQWQGPLDACLLAARSLPVVSAPCRVAKVWLCFLLAARTACRQSLWVLAQPRCRGCRGQLACRLTISTIWLGRGVKVRLESPLLSECWRGWGVVDAHSELQRPAMGCLLHPQDTAPLS